MKRNTQESIREFLAENEIELACTHTKLCLPVIDRIYRKMLLGIKFSGIKVDKNLICDGHHRYFASLLAGISIDRVPFSSTSAAKITNWNSVIFVAEDWDTEAKIDMLNEEDANFNNVSIDVLKELLK